MTLHWHRFLLPFTAGVRTMLVVLTAAFVAAWIGQYSGKFNLYDWLALSSPTFWKGGIWQIFTYALLPVGLFDFLINGFMLTWLGVFLERVWSKTELWLYCLLCAAGAGLAKVLLQPSSPILMAGTAGAVFGLLVAWGMIFRYERILLMCLWEMSIRTAAVFMGLFTLFLMLPCAGPVNALILLCGGLTGWLYLVLRWKITRWQPCQVVASERIGRLEL